MNAQNHGHEAANRSRWSLHRRLAGLARQTAPLVLLGLLGLALGACLPDASELIGDPPDLSGTWTGTITENNIPPTSGTLELTANHSDLHLNGTFIAIFPIAGIVNSGTFDGWMNEDRTAGDFYLDPSDPNYCPMRATMNMLGRRIEGTYATQSVGGCLNGTQTGSLEITKQ